MSIPIPVKMPHDGPASGNHSHKPIVPPDDPNADRIDRAPDIDPPPTEPPQEEPPDTIERPVRACELEVAGDWMMVGPFLPTCGLDRPIVTAAI
jgi:hypothetical protein